eukprot:gene6369-9294_t
MASDSNGSCDHDSTRLQFRRPPTVALDLFRTTTNQLSHDHIQTQRADPLTNDLIKSRDAVSAKDLQKIEFSSCDTLTTSTGLNNQLNSDKTLNVQSMDDIDVEGMKIELGKDGVLRLKEADMPAAETSSNFSSNVQTSLDDGEKTRQLLNILAKQPIGPNYVRVDIRQKGNPVLKHIRNVPWQYCQQSSDFVMGKRICGLFLSLRYHRLHPEYIHTRLREVGSGYQVRVLFVLVDIRDSQSILTDLAKLCIQRRFTLILGWSNREIGRYIETYKAYENKSSDALQETPASDYISQVVKTLTSAKSVNKADAVTLMSTFGSVANIIQADENSIHLCPGFGEKKASKLKKLFTTPFVNPNRLRPSRFK